MTYPGSPTYGEGVRPYSAQFAVRAQAVYLAGKISRGDWRLTVLDRRPATNDMSGAWPRLAGALAGVFDYVGPYFTQGTHGGDHAVNGHGAAGWEAGMGTSSAGVMRKCFDAIASCDVFFAWLEGGTAYGTLVELGYAKALGKKIVIGAPFRPECNTFGGHDAYSDGGPEDAEHPLRDQWFAFAAADRIIVAPDPIKAVEILVADERTFDSPIEAMFWREYVGLRPLFREELVPQFEVFDGRYRLDFALPGIQVAIELDGYEFHSAKDVFTKDRQRQRELEMAGWRVIRFSGSEVNAAAASCVCQASDLINVWFGQAK